MRENAETKARRYLTESRLTVLYVHHGSIRATCRGDGHTYKLGYYPGSGSSAVDEVFEEISLALRLIRAATKGAPDAS